MNQPNLHDVTQLSEEAGMTRRLLVDAGIAPGMRVVDVGCGRGAVSLLLAELVGPRGAVLAVDRNPQFFAQARALAAARGQTWLRFVEADFTELASDELFDAAVGRRVLMYQADALAAVQGLMRVIRPGGLIVFQEHDTTMTPASRVPLPLHEQVHRWIWETIAREGADVHMGFELPRVLARAGLLVEHVRAEAIVQTPTRHNPLTEIMRWMVPRIVAQGVAREHELDIETLDARLLAERTAADATYVGDMVFGVWARKP